jgi:hypothetical protein
MAHKQRFYFWLSAMVPNSTSVASHISTGVQASASKAIIEAAKFAKMNGFKNIYGNYFEAMLWLFGSAYLINFKSGCAYLYTLK